MPYEIGATVVLRDFQEDGRTRAVECDRVVADDEQGTAVWVGGEPTRHLPVETKPRTPTLPTVGTWQGFGVLILTPPAPTRPGARPTCPGGGTCRERIDGLQRAVC